MKQVKQLVRNKFISVRDALRRLFSALHDSGALKFLKTVLLHFWFIAGLTIIVRGVQMIYEPASYLVAGLMICLLVVAERADMLNKARKTK